MPEQVDERASGEGTAAGDASGRLGGRLFPLGQGSVVPTKGGSSAAGQPGGVGLKANARFAGGRGLAAGNLAVPTALRRLVRNKASNSPLSLADLMGTGYY